MYNTSRAVVSSTQSVQLKPRPNLSGVDTRPVGLPRDRGSHGIPRDPACGDTASGEGSEMEAQLSGCSSGSIMYPSESLPVMYPSEGIGC